MILNVDRVSVAQCDQQPAINTVVKKKGNSRYPDSLEPKTTENADTADERKLLCSDCELL